MLYPEDMSPHPPPGLLTVNTYWRSSVTLLNDIARDKLSLLYSQTSDPCLGKEIKLNLVDQTGKKEDIETRTGIQECQWEIEVDEGCVK